MAVPNFERAFSQATAKATWEQVLLARLAVQAYRGEHNNALPSSLRELIVGTKPYLSRMPTDFFSVSGADSLRYDPLTGEVYSVGENGVDDGNKGDDNGDLYKK